jgi:hypothetical protein
VGENDCGGCCILLGYVYCALWYSVVGCLVFAGGVRVGVFAFAILVAEFGGGRMRDLASAKLIPSVAWMLHTFNS